MINFIPASLYITEIKRPVTLVSPNVVFFVISDDYTILIQMNIGHFRDKILPCTLCCIFQKMKFDILRKSVFINQFRALILDAYSSQWYLLKRHLFLHKDSLIISFTKAFVKVF